MILLTRALVLLPAIGLLVALPRAADSAPVHHARPHAVVRKPTAASNAIIPVPLQPIVPGSQRLCESKTPAGLGYTILRPGSGPKPGADDTVLIGYIGYLAGTGAVFDQNERTPLPVGGVIPGFSQGLQMMPKGSVMRLCIPAAMGYGARASGPIPANSDLVFQVELLDFRTAAQIEDMRKSQAPEQTPEKGAATQQ